MDFGYDDDQRLSPTARCSGRLLQRRRAARPRRGRALHAAACGRCVATGLHGIVVAPRPAGWAGAGHHRLDGGAWSRAARWAWCRWPTSSWPPPRWRASAPGGGRMRRHGWPWAQSLVALALEGPARRPQWAGLHARREATAWCSMAAPMRWRWGPGGGCCCRWRSMAPCAWWRYRGPPPDADRGPQPAPPGGGGPAGRSPPRRGRLRCWPTPAPWPGSSRGWWRHRRAAARRAVGQLAARSNTSASASSSAASIGTFQLVAGADGRCRSRWRRCARRWRSWSTGSMPASRRAAGAGGEGAGCAGAPGGTQGAARARRHGRGHHHPIHRYLYWSRVAGAYAGRRGTGAAKRLGDWLAERPRWAGSTTCPKTLGVQPTEPRMRPMNVDGRPGAAEAGDPDHRAAGRRRRHRHRDYFPGHHDLDAAPRAGLAAHLHEHPHHQRWCSATSKGGPGPTAEFKSVKIKLGAPNYPGDTMTFTGEVLDRRRGLARRDSPEGAATRWQPRQRHGPRRAG